MVVLVVVVFIGLELLAAVEDGFTMLVVVVLGELVALAARLLLEGVRSGLQTGQSGLLQFFQ